MRILLSSVASLLLVACSSTTPADEPAPPVDDSPLGGSRPVEPLLPSSYDPEVPVPLLILLHGYGASGLANDLVLGLAGEVEPRGFILRRPDGTVDEDGRRFWNAATAQDDGAADYSRDVDGPETEVRLHPGCHPGGAAVLWTMVGEGHLPGFNDAWRQAALDFLLGT